MKKSRLLAGAALLGVLAAPAARAGSLYVFGDSLSDNGNLYKLTGQPPAPYYEGRFSNGPIWVEYLPTLTGLNFSASNDTAYGGAFTGDLTIGRMDLGTNLESQSLPGINTEIADFAAAGGSFSNTDVVTLWGGANNYFAYAAAVQATPSAATSLITQGVSTTLTQLTEDTNALIQLGARMLIVPNLPDLGLTPQFNTSTQGIALGDAFSQAHNANLPALMQGLHQASGANIIVLNTEALLNRVVADPSLYGFTNVTNACLYTASCVTGSTAIQDSYLFWDKVHPTTHAQEIIAEYAAASLRGFEGLTVPGRLGNNAAQSFTNLLNGRLDALQNGASGASYSISGVNGGVADPSHPLGLFLAVTGQLGNRNSEGFDLGYRYRSAVTALGLDARINNHLTAGVALAYNISHADVSGGGTVQDNGVDVGVYALATEGNAYAKMTAGYNADSYKTERAGVIGGITGKPNGGTWSASGAVGLQFHPLPIVAVGPEFGLTYTNSKVDAYTESGDSLLTQSVSSQTFQQLIGSVGVNAASTLRMGGVSFAPYASVAAQFLLSGQNNQFSSYFTDMPGVTLTSTFPHQPGSWGLFSAGASASLSQSLNANLAVSSTAFKADGNDLQLTCNAVWRF
ncbi:autotransporter domain-containing protein [Acidocella aminolytica]|jgi:outer membrane lipase/esterase|uniref:Outer membrane autotransporter/esterase n=1 Tax=Acidocella aminolytica 101 = DSM 11237 TaxID=1120923 RepID=A0A0D6PEY3_9PROT|nr:autotransporter domain-containing protein [Acidocella aminolytica]GAN80310.1 outer membrane autotransporter/esterase [Acidocella aminolytica 101 = DSM 11237]GBQ33358.1 outer membrane autotransporter [Acidocella aminolytica 101 = DSM 11237]SHF49358.1 outer membrane lipase/esterase [Acidocella aminolytica 101 = DSM 11237]